MKLQTIKPASVSLGVSSFNTWLLIVIAEAARQIRKGVGPPSTPRTIPAGRRTPASLVGRGCSVRHRRPHVSHTHDTCYLGFPLSLGDPRRPSFPIKERGRRRKKRRRKNRGVLTPLFFLLLFFFFFLFFFYQGGEDRRGVEGQGVEDRRAVEGQGVEDHRGVEGRELG